MRIVILALLMLFASHTASEGGMIPFNSEAGEIGGRGHWYSLRTMKGADYWNDPANLTDILQDENGDYNIAGEPPVSLVILLHPEFYQDDEPWRRAIDWVRQVEQMFRNSGVPIRFIIEHIETVPDLPDTVYETLTDVRTYASRTADWYDADLAIVLIPQRGFDKYCGVAELPREYTHMTVSVSACGPETLAHEMGHQFGLQHSFSRINDLSSPVLGDLNYNRGYCIFPAGSEERECEEGTLMSYAQNRRPFFANPNAEYRGDVLGNETSDAVRWLNKVKTGRALTSELRAGADFKEEEQLEIIFCD